MCSNSSHRFKGSINMLNKRTLRRGLLAGAAALAFAACSDTEIASPGTTTTPTPTPTPSATPTPTATINLVPTNGCYAGTTQIPLATSGDLVDMDVCALSGDISSDVTIPEGATVAISGIVNVGVDGGASATLTIEPGAVLFGSEGADVLVVNRGSEIIASGTSSNPIVFTARADINTDGSAGANTNDALRGQWGGIALNGFAPINACDDATATGGTAGCVKAGEGSTGEFGGDNPADSSGTLQYVQVRYAGFEITSKNELNGIAFQGVGSGTTVDHIQVHNNADDGVEFFGGTVGVKYVLLTGNDDDSMDYTDGWAGSAQFVVVEHFDDGAGDQGFEFDNNGDDNIATPFSDPTISNFTIVGSQAGSSDIGMLIREGTKGTFVNGIVSGGWDDGALDIDQSATFDNLQAGDITFGSLLLDANISVIEEAGDAVDLTDFFAANFSNVVADGATLVDGFFPGTREGNIPTVDPTTFGSFFSAADRIGAFNSTETAENNWTTGWTFDFAGSGAIDECPAGTNESTEEINGQKICRLTGTLIDDTVLAPGVLYELVGKTEVGRDVGADGASASGTSATLTIQPGVTLFGSSGADFLVVNRGSKIRANGTEANPITMTSRSDVEGTATAATRGEWGGLIINGRAPINACDDATATGGSNDCVKAGEGSTGEFGGDLSTDDSGNLFYLIVKHAGFEITAKNELNGIAFQGVGSGTDVDYVQVYNNADDGVEFFGGTVNASHLFLNGNDDDSMDYTDGWTGSAQFVIVEHFDDGAGDQGFEFDNNGDDNIATPFSDPTISNFTIVGSETGSSDIGMLIREGTKGTFINGVVGGGWDDGALDIDQSATFDNLQAAGGDITFGSLYLGTTTANNFVDEAGDPVVLSTFIPANFSNIVEGADALAGFVPGTAITAVTAVDPTTEGLAAGSYVGAVEDANDTWYEGWTFRPSE